MQNGKDLEAIKAALSQLLEMVSHSELNGIKKRAIPKPEPKVELPVEETDEEEADESVEDGDISGVAKESLNKPDSEKSEEELDEDEYFSKALEDKAKE